MNPPTRDEEVEKMAKEYASGAFVDANFGLKEVVEFAFKSGASLGYKMGVEAAAKMFDIPIGEENNLTTDGECAYKIRKLLEMKEDK